jgi:hypothetical protein
MIGAIEPISYIHCMTNYVSRVLNMLCIHNVATYQWREASEGSNYNHTTCLYEIFNPEFLFDLNHHSTQSTKTKNKRNVI